MQEWRPLEGYLTDRGDGWVARLHFAQDARGRVELSRIEVDGLDGPLQPDVLRRLQIARHVAWLNGDEDQRARARAVLALGGELVLDTTPRLRLAGSNAAPKPAGFYERVAELYGDLTARGERGAAKRIAQANGVPVTTVHNWIKEARRRELLPPGSPGRAG